MIHTCTPCGNSFRCNGGRGTDCTCGEYLVPRLLRQCPTCKGIEEDLNNRPPPPPLRHDPPEVYNIREIELCRCNKCETLLGRVRFVV